MAQYALLLRANVNRVFGASAFALAAGELTALAPALGGVLEEPERTTIGGVAQGADRAAHRVTITYGQGKDVGAHHTVDRSITRDVLVAVRPAS